MFRWTHRRKFRENGLVSDLEKLSTESVDNSVGKLVKWRISIELEVHWSNFSQKPNFY